MLAQLRIRELVRVTTAARHNCSRVESGIDAELMPADSLELEFGVRLDVADTAVPRPPIRELVHAPVAAQDDFPSLRDIGQRRGEPAAVRPQADTRPPVLPYDAIPDLLGADDGDRAHDRVVWKALTVGFLDAHAILYQDDARLGRHQRCDHRRVVGSVGKRLSGDYDVVPAMLRRGVLRGGIGRGLVVGFTSRGGRRDGGKHGMRSEGIISERASLERDAGAKDSCVIGPCYERCEDVVRRL